MRLGGGQDDFFTLSPHLLNGIDVSQVQDIDRVEAIELPTVTDSSGKPLFTGLYSGPYFDLRRMAKNQTVQIGENALIHCAVKQSGEKSVSTCYAASCLSRFSILSSSGVMGAKKRFIHPQR